MTRGGDRSAASRGGRLEPGAGPFPTIAKEFGPDGRRPSVDSSISWPVTALICVAEQQAFDQLAKSGQTDVIYAFVNTGRQG
ncbi:hypothetical protein VCV18_001986 [Metarhizium anisopliae]